MIRWKRYPRKPKAYRGRTYADILQTRDCVAGETYTIVTVFLLAQEYVLRLPGDKKSRKENRGEDAAEG